ncbi:sigma-70 family RNA polymerase sigma factor [Sphingomonas populi]|uniref:Sigma-70 family RNA polymerase sigma factor n=2 Tax=Sphingomonas populi TaxID=2484750 RepID=A0A4Q6XL47_9SPHN|nr:sigma-70 family RNA polymerase sigma factor [Sphingomonas populi]
MSPDLHFRNAWIARNILPHEPTMRRFLARQLLPPGIDEEDVVQEVYGRLIEMPSLGDIRNPRSYMIGLARNIVLMHLRRARIVAIRSLEEMAETHFAADDPSPETQASDRQQLHLLAQAIASLDEPARSVFLLRAVDGLPYADIAHRLGLSENAVQKRHARALEQFMMLLGRDGNAPAHATPLQSQTCKASNDERA